MATFTLSVGAQQEFKCAKEGYFAKPDNCKFFYKCKKQGGNIFLKENYRCPDQYVFVDDKTTCMHWLDIHNTTDWCTFDKNAPTGDATMISVLEIANFFKPSEKFRGNVAKPGDCRYYMKWEWSNDKPNHLEFLNLYRCPQGTTFNSMYQACHSMPAESDCVGCPDAVGFSGALEGSTTQTKPPPLPAGMVDDNDRFFAKPGNCKLFYLWNDLERPNRISLRLLQCPEGYRFNESEGKCFKKDQTGACKINPFDDYSGAELLEEDDELVQ